jgi:hypothetical protein
MEHVIASYLRKIWDKHNWLFDGQHGFRPGYSCENQLITVYQDIADSLDNGSRIEAIIRDFSKAFDLVPHDRLLTKIVALGVDARVVGYMDKGIPSGPCAESRVGGHLSEEVRVTSGVPQGSVLSPLLFLAYVTDIWINIDSTIRLFADDCIIYREVKNNNMENLQTDLNRLGKWAVENAMKINPTKSKVVCLTRARVKEPLNYILGGMVIPEVSSCKYLEIILRNDLC